MRIDELNVALPISQRRLYIRQNFALFPRQNLATTFKMHILHFASSLKRIALNGLMELPLVLWIHCVGHRKHSRRMTLLKKPKSLSKRLEGVAKWWIGQKGTCDWLSQILCMLTPKGEKSDKADDRRETAAKVSALVIANALIFQEHLAATNVHIIPLRKLSQNKIL
jgi:hypothetical protein